MCSFRKWAFILKLQKVKGGLLSSISHSYSRAWWVFKRSFSELSLYGHRFPCLVTLSPRFVLGCQVAQETVVARGVGNQWQSSPSKSHDYQESRPLMFTPCGEVNLPAFAWSLWTLVCFNGKLIFFELMHSLFLPYTYANHITCRFLSIIIHIHIHEQCCLPLAIWLLLNLICIILRNWTVSQHGNEDVFRVC